MRILKIVIFNYKRKNSSSLNIVYLQFIGEGWAIEIENQ